MFDPAEILHGEPERLACSYRDGVSASVFGVCAFGRAALSVMAAAAAEKAGKGAMLYVAGDFYLAREAYNQLSAMTDGVYLLPARDDALVYRAALAGENVATRLSALAAIASGKARIVVCSAEALIQIYPERGSFASHCLNFKKGEEYDLGKVTAALVEAGYRREPQLTDEGRFSLRGDILDVWPMGAPRPVRIEFFGDEAESIRYFDADDQVSTEEADGCFVPPATELCVSSAAADEIISKLEEKLPRGLAPDFELRARELTGELTGRLAAGDRAAPLSYLLPLAPHGNIYDFGGFYGTVYDEVKQIYDNASLAYSEHLTRFKGLSERGETLLHAAAGLIKPEEVYRAGGVGLAYQSVMNANRIFSPRAVFEFRTATLPAYFRDYEAFLTDLLDWSMRGYTVFVCAPTDSLKASLVDFFRDKGVPYSSGAGEGGVRLVSATVDKGGVFHREKAVVVGLNELARKNPKKKIKRSKSEVFAAPEPGEYVVHEVHGIGRFEGVVKMEVGGVRRDYLLVCYAGSDKLYVPVESMDTLSKYVADGGEPTLNRLGGAEFARIKEKVKKRVKELAINLLELYGERFEMKGHKYDPDDTLLNEFAASFEFTETDDQLTAVEEALGDLKSGKVMDRLLCGDVGYGKTEVALRVAFKVMLEGKQVAFLAPTTILADQHFETVKRRMEPFGIRAVRLTRFDTKKEQEAAIAALKAGKADIVVGTHRLLGKDVDFKDLGLLILDEEQRFGVADKEKIKNLRRGVNVLTLSATPIPRTLHMSLTGIRDISVLDTPPMARIPVQTGVMEYSETLVADAVSREINRGGQAFIVYNRVSDIATYAARVQQLVPSAKVAYAHGQMNEDALERTIAAFAEGKTDVLVTSTIIENGIDIARANTMIVVDADRLGLSQLYQLRGRVGRSTRLAYVFFTFDGRKTLTDEAYKRLDAITQFTEFGSGFKIAMRDLEIRGAGTVLGAEQHGHMEKVGYDMYCKLLSEAVGELRGERAETKSEVKASVDFAAYLPESYVTDREWRLRIYARIARTASIKERDALLLDLGDVYGPVPAGAKNLIDLALMKNLAGKLGAASITLRRGEYSVGFGKAAAKMKGAAAVAMREEGRIDALTATIKFPSPARVLKFLLKCNELAGSNV